MIRGGGPAMHFLWQCAVILYMKAFFVPVIEPLSENPPCR